MTDWKKPSDYQMPPASACPAEMSLADCVQRDLLRAAVKFRDGAEGPQYVNPRAYTRSMIEYAFDLTQNTFNPPNAPEGWDFVGAGMDYADSCFLMLTHLPVNAADSDSASVYDAWISGKWNLYGGHDPIPAGQPSNTGDGVNEATGQSAAPPGTIL